MDRCKKFKEKMLGFTNQLIETEKRKTKTAVRDAQRAVRLLETDLALLHSQHEEADLVIRNQKDADKVIRRVVEEKFAESLNQLGDHKNRLDTKIEAQLETNKAIQKRFVEVQAMFQELQKQRLFADPFVRRRAENLVKGLLRNLNEQDIKEQEEREQEMSAHYQQWKKIVEFCNEKERQLGLMESQEASLREEITNQTARIEKERVLYRERVKVLKSKDDEQSGRLKVLEEKLSDKARDERRKLHFEQRGEARKQPMHLSHAITTNIPEKRSAGGSGGDGGAVECNSDSEGGDDYQSQSDHREGAAGNTGNDADTSDSESSSESSSSENSQHSDSGDGGATTGKFSKTDARSKRIKQHGVRTVAPLCDDYTEVLLGVTHEHTKRQEISRTVFTHIPRPAAGHVTGSEQSDTALLVKAQKMLSDLHPQQAAPPEGAEARQGISKFAEETSVGTVGEGETALAAKDKPEPAEPAEPAEPEPEWATQTNSTPKTTAVVKFGQDSSRRQSSLSRKSNGSSSKVKYGFWAEVDPGEVDGGESSSEEEDGFFPGGSKDERRQKGVQVHSLTSTACYVALYYRYLKKFPNLNFKKDNPRLQSPTQQIVRNPLLPTAAPSDAKSGASDQVGSRASVIGSANDATATPVAASSELVNKNNRFQFSVKEGLVVVKEALDALLQCKVVDKIIISEALSKMSELERRGKLAGIPEEEKEVRYQLHFLCVSLIHTVLSRGPRVLLVKNNRKYFVEISSCMLALLGVVLNCSLVFWQPRSVSKSSKSTKSSKIHSRSGAISSGAGVGAGGGIAMDRVEFICAHLIELVITLGDVDTSHPLSDSSGGTVAAITENRSTRRSSKKSGKNFKVKKPTDTPPGPAGFISLLRIQTAELLHKKQEEKLSTAGAGSAGSAGDRGSSLSREDRRGTPKSSRPGSTPHSSNSEGLGVNYHDLLEVFNKIVDEDAPIESVVGQDGTFTMKHRHAILSLQLFLYLSLNNNEMPMENAILLLHKGIMDGVASVRADESNVIPCDVDILLQQMHPGMVPAVLTLELIRRVLEAEFERVAFLKKIADAHHDVADLQFLNVEFASQFDVSMKTNRQMMSNKPKGSHLCEGSGSSVGTVSLPSLSITAPAPTLGAPSDGPAEVPSSPRSVHPMHITRFKTTKSVHVQWVEDLELNLRQLSEEIIALIRPPSVATGVREPSFMSDKPPAAVATEGLLSPSSQKSTKNPVIPLPDILVYQMLAHINTLRSITMTHSINGLARVESLQPAFVQIMRDLLAARSRITAIVTAMTWPMRKKLDWLKLKYNTLLEENAAATNQVGEFKALLDRYKRDIETFKSSIAQVDKEKHSMDYRHTRTLLLEHHDSQIQDLIVEHATDEYLHKLTDFRARETRLNSTILQFTTEHAQLMAQADTLKAAQRSLSMIDQAQDSAETSMRSDHAGQSGFGDKFGLEGMDALGGFDQYRDGVNNLNEFQAPKVPPAVSELLNAVDEFVHTQRLAGTCSNLLFTMLDNLEWFLCFV